MTATDGTPLAVWVEGSGPPLVLVHGSIADHTTFDPFVAVLREEWTTNSMDRRGFGASGDADPWSLDQDFDGGAARARAGSVVHLGLYESSLGLTYPAGSIERVEAALAAGDEETAIVTALVDILDMADEEIDALRASPR
ncbi:MAG TPA: hypothetical protein VIL36_05890 [Acidimicrobiales bacterium]